MDVLAPFLIELLHQPFSLGVVLTVLTSHLCIRSLPADFEIVSSIKTVSAVRCPTAPRPYLFVPTAVNSAVLQSAYRASHSTETAILKVLGDILGAVDSGDLAILTLINVSAAFDTADHPTLLQRISTSDGHAVESTTGLRYGRSQHVRPGRSNSTPTTTVLGFIIFLLYTARPAAADRATRPAAESLRRQHTDLGLLSF